MKYTLFTTTRCHKCPAMLAFSDKLKLNGIQGVSYNETHTDFDKLCGEYNVIMAPTLFLFRGTTIIERFDDLAEAEYYYDTQLT